MSVHFALAFVLFAVPDRPDPTPKESRPPQEQILGDWLYVSNGQDATPAPTNPRYVYQIRPNESVWITNGVPSPSNGFTATIKLDWTKTPVALDMMPRHGGQTLYAIIRLDGDRLTLAWSNNTTRPVDFVAPHNIHHFTRIKK